MYRAQLLRYPSRWMCLCLQKRTLGNSRESLFTIRLPTVSVIPIATLCIVIRISFQFDFKRTLKCLLSMRPPLLLPSCRWLEFKTVSVWWTRIWHGWTIRALDKADAMLKLSTFQALYKIGQPFTIYHFYIMCFCTILGLLWRSHCGYDDPSRCGNSL